MPQEAHELNTKWCMWHIPAITSEMSAKYGSWETANLKLTTNVNTFGSVEMFWAIYTALPPATKLPKDETVMFYREGVAPKWEDPAFAVAGDKPAGGRWLCKLNLLSSADKFIERLLVEALGENISLTTNTANLVGGIRYLKKDNRRDQFVRVEVWITDGRHSNEIKDLLMKVADESEVTSAYLGQGDNLAFKPF